MRPKGTVELHTSLARGGLVLALVGIALTAVASTTMTRFAGFVGVSLVGVVLHLVGLQLSPVTRRKRRRAREIRAERARWRDLANRARSRAHH